MKTTSNAAASLDSSADSSAGEVSPSWFAAPEDAASLSSDSEVGAGEPGSLSARGIPRSSTASSQAGPLRPHAGCSPCPSWRQVE